MDRTRKLLAKEKERLFHARLFSLSERWGSYQVDHLFLWRMERAQKTDYLSGIDQKIPVWSIKIVFLEKVETTIR